MLVDLTRKGQDPGHGHQSGTADPEVPNDPDSIRFWCVIRRRMSGREIERTQTRIEAGVRAESCKPYSVTVQP